MPLLAGPYPHSAHPYAHGTDSQTYTGPTGVANLYVRFDERTEFAPNGRDSLEIADASWTDIPDSEPAGSFTTAQLAGRVVTVPGEVANFTLRTATSGATAWGYAVTAIRSVFAIADDSILPVTFHDGSTYSHQFTLLGGYSAVWSRSSGTLPPGTTLTSGGLLSGVITGTGVYTFTVRAAVGSDIDSVEFVLTVEATGPILAYNTFTFERIWFSYLITASGFTLNGLYTDSSDVGGHQYPAFAISSGIEAQSNLGSPRGVLAMGASVGYPGRGAPWFIGQGKPDLCYPVKIDNLDIWTASGAPSRFLGMLQYWDMSHGAWWHGGKYWALFRHHSWVTKLRDNPGKLCMVKSIAHETGTDGVSLIPTLWHAIDQANEPDTNWTIVACRWDGSSAFVDVMCQHDGSATEYALYTVDLAAETWGSPYGVIDFGDTILFGSYNSPGGSLVNGWSGNQLYRFPNNDIGIVYTRRLTGNVNGEYVLYYRLFERATMTWGSEIVIDDQSASGKRITMGQVIPDPGRELLHLFPVYNTGWSPQGRYHTIAHNGTVTLDVFAFPAYDASDGFGHGLVYTGRAYVPYDDDAADEYGFSPKSNEVWWGPLNTNEWTDDELPKPDIEAGQAPSCAYLIYSRAYAPPPPVPPSPFSILPQYIKRRNLLGH